jgi:hypothetical protein
VVSEEEYASFVGGCYDPAPSDLLSRAKRFSLALSARFSDDFPQLWSPITWQSMVYLTCRLLQSSEDCAPSRTNRRTYTFLENYTDRWSCNPGVGTKRFVSIEGPPTPKLTYHDTNETRVYKDGIRAQR